MPTNKKPQSFHRFLDEAGDATFFGKGRINILGQEGVSKMFALGMVHIKKDLMEARQEIFELSELISKDPYFCKIPSVKKKIDSGGFYFHAKDDPAEVKYVFYEYLQKKLPFTLQAFVGRKIPSLFANKHGNNEHEFYADLLHHLLKSKMNHEKLVLNIAERGNSTRMANLENAVKNARTKFATRTGKDGDQCKIVFNIQNQRLDPLLAVPDYALWSVQRIFERGETRFYDALNIAKKIPQVVDLYDYETIELYPNQWKNYYSLKNPLTEKNKIGPPST